MKKFELKNGSDLEIEINLTYQRKPFLIFYDIWDGELDITGVYEQQGKVDLIELCSESVLSELKGLIIKKLKFDDEQDYISAVAA